MNRTEFIPPSSTLATRANVKVREPIFTRIRFQLGGCFLVAIVLPSFIRFQVLFGQTPNNNAIQTVIGAVLAISIGFFISRRLAKFPSDVARPHIFSIYIITFGITISLFFMLRLDYNRYLFLSSFVICLLWFTAVHFTIRRFAKTKMTIIPGGNAKELLKIGHVQWTLLSSPEKYDPNDGFIVADLRHDFSPDWERFIADKTLVGISVFHSKKVQELLTGKVDIEHLSENSSGSLLPEMDYLRFRQAIDVIATIVLLPILLVIMAIVGLIILLTSGRPIIFAQERIGYGGELFTAYKFRTMVSAEEVHHLSEDIDGNSVEGDEKAGKLRIRAVTKTEDKRITRFGAILRKYRIDELPQAINILKGEMSWIGPRPEALALSQWYQKELPFYSYRHVVRPGITGWAQVNQGHVTDADQVLEKLHYDFFYIKNLSVWLDLLIVLKTVKVVLLGIGAK